MSRKRNHVEYTDDYRKQLGKKLRTKRLELGYTQSHISFIAEISRETVKNVENGSTKGLDYYIEFAKAIEYKLTDLFNIVIELKPRIELSEEQKKTVRFTQIIRHNLLLKGFFKKEKTVDDVNLRLVELKFIKKTSSYSTQIAGVMRNMVEDESLKVSRQEAKGKINYYIEK